MSGKGYYPFTDDCERFENGIQTTQTNCKEQFESGQLFNVVSRIRDRRFVAVDRERGIVFAFGFFDHVQINWTWQIAELFKIEKGMIRRIEAVFHRCPLRDGFRMESLRIKYIGFYSEYQVVAR